MDKFTLVAEALKNLLETDLRLQVVGIVGDSDSLFAAAEAGKPDIVVLSIYRPFGVGLEIARLLKDACPTTRIIVLTTNVDAKTAAECVKVPRDGPLWREVQRRTFPPRCQSPNC